MQSNNEVLEFIRRRFPCDPLASWTTKNCYYFAIILKARFAEGSIYYDVVDGHFLFLYKGWFYDYYGIAFSETDIPNPYRVIEWDKFDNYDRNQQQRIIEYCIL